MKPDKYIFLKKQRNGDRGYRGYHFIHLAGLGQLSIYVVISFAESNISLNIPLFFGEIVDENVPVENLFIQFSVFLSFLIWYCSPYLWVA